MKNRKRKRSEEGNNEEKDISGQQEYSSSASASEESPSEPINLSLHTLTQINAAFTASTLTQPPLLEGKRFLIILHCFKAQFTLAFKLFDRCISLIDWTSSNSNRDLMTDYFTANAEFIPTMINLWSFSWEVWPKIRLYMLI